MTQTIMAMANSLAIMGGEMQIKEKESLSKWIPILDKSS